MPITLTISTSSLNLMASDCKQVRGGRVWAGFGQAGVSSCTTPQVSLEQGMPPASPGNVWVGCVMSAHLPAVPGAEEVGGISLVLCGISPGDGKTQVPLPGARSPGFDPTPADVPVLFLVVCGS